jgi:hypothetical protein
MAGIEEAFEKFVTRVSSRERSPAEQPLSKYKSYSEQELLENIEAKYPNQLQSFSQEDYQLNTMPMFEPRDVAPPKSYSPMPVEKYLRGREYMDLAKGGVAGMFRQRPGYADGGSLTPMTIKIKDNGDFLVTNSLGNSTLYHRTYDQEYIQNLINYGGYSFSGQQGSTGMSTPTTTEIPTVDPFSGQQVSTQDQTAFTQPQAEIFPQQELPTVQPEAPFQPYEGQSTPYDSISNRLENVFNNPAVKGYSNFITGSGNPFQDINQFTTAQQNVINQAIKNATNQGRTNITYADYPQTGIAQLMDDGFTPMEYLKTLGSSMFGNPVDQIKTTLGQFSYNPETNKIFDRYDFQRQLGNNLGTPYDVNINLRNNPVQRTVNVGSSDIGTQALGASVGNLDFATMNALRNNADLLNTITGQTTNMAKGGRVSMSNGGLTKTVPPVRGPSPQGVESLFRRRYN